MATASQNLISEVTEISTRTLVESGLRKRSAQVFTRDIAEDMIGWVGLNRAVNREDGKLELNPVIGVRHQPVEVLVAKLSGVKYHAYIPPTISTPLGYLMPVTEYTAWLFESGADNVLKVNRLVQAVRTWGYSFMEANSSLPELIETMVQSGFGYPHQTAYRIPVAYQLIGETRIAEEYINEHVNALSTRDDLAADHYRAFAVAFLEQSSSRPT